MRFELKEKDVNALSGLIHYILEDVLGAVIKGEASMLHRGLLANCETLFKKLKVYGLSAYANREEFREDIKAIQGEMEYQIERLGL